MDAQLLNESSLSLLACTLSPPDLAIVRFTYATCLSVRELLAIHPWDLRGEVLSVRGQQPRTLNLSPALWCSSEPIRLAQAQLSCQDRGGWLFLPHFPDRREAARSLVRRFRFGCGLLRMPFRWKDLRTTAVAMAIRRGVSEAHLDHVLGMQKTTGKGPN